MSQPRGISGADSFAAISASNENDEKIGDTFAPCHRRRVSCATARPVCASKPGVGLISMCAMVSFDRSRRAASSNAGIGSPRKASECQLPASSTCRFA